MNDPEKVCYLRDPLTNKLIKVYKEELTDEALASEDCIPFDEGKPNAKKRKSMEELEAAWLDN